MYGLCPQAVSPVVRTKLLSPQCLGERAWRARGCVWAPALQRTARPRSTVLSTTQAGCPSDFVCSRLCRYSQALASPSTAGHGLADAWGIVSGWTRNPCSAVVLGWLLQEVVVGVFPAWWVSLHLVVCYFAPTLPCAHREHTAHHVYLVWAQAARRPLTLH